METSHKKRLGVNRWWILGFTLLGAVAYFFYKPISPVIKVAPENLTAAPLFVLPVIGKFYLTNTMLASLFVYVILLIIAYLVKRALSKGEMAPGGIAGAVEMMVEAGYNLTENSAGKWASVVFPFFATIMLVVLVANWMELIPGVDSFGLISHSGHEGYGTLTLIPGVLGAIVGGKVEGGAEIVPFVRVASTDLNFTAALALISVVMTQVIGVRAQGMGYFSKFFNTTTLFKKPFFGFMDLIVSLLEMISEFAKILSFSFRLFGNVFAGMILLILVGTMIPFVASFLQSIMLMFEFFIGLIQAFVFGMLTMVFMSQATHGHGDHESE